MKIVMTSAIITVFAVSACINTTKAILEDSGSAGSNSSNSTAAASKGPVSTCNPSDLSDFDKALSAYRTSHGLTSITTSAALGQAASVHSADIAPRGSVSHVGADGSRLEGRVGKVGYEYRGLAENIGKVRGGAADVLAQWDGSPGHRANLRGDYADYGIACTNGSDGYEYWTLVIGRSA